MPPIDTNTWEVTDSPATRRSADVQKAYDYFKAMEAGKSVLIPGDQGATAKNAASQLKKESDGLHVVRFRDEAGKVRATKISSPPAEETATNDE